MRRSLASAWLLLVACSGAPSTPARPSGCPTGHVLLAGDDDVAAFAACKSAASIAIRTGAVLDTKVLSLESIAGDLVVGPSFGLAELALPHLRQVGGAIRVASNANLTGIYMPVLEAAGVLDIASNVALQTISMPRVGTVGGALSITDGAALEMLDLSRLARIDGELAITNNPQLSLVEAGTLASAHAVRIENNAMLPPDTVEMLRSKGAAR